MLVPSLTLALPEAIAATDHLRGSPAHLGEPAGHKEWLHFCILGPTVELLVNFSLCDDLGSTAAPGAEVGRLTVLVRAAGWDGDVDTFETCDVSAPAGRIALAFGANTLRFEDGTYVIRVALRERPIAAELRLRPRTAPVRAPNVPLRDGPPLHWVIVPRLDASGTVTVGDRTWRLDDVPAYHDHNWGRFRWGQDFAWRWGFAVPDDPAVPWSLAFALLGDRSRSHALSQGVFLWKGTRPRRAFRDYDLDVQPAATFLRPRAVLKVPRVMALLAPELPTEVPSGIDLLARDGADWLRYRFTACDLAQVVIPSETQLGVTVINEVIGRSRVTGRVRGETFAMECRSVFEFLGG